MGDYLALPTLIRKNLTRDSFCGIIVYNKMRRENEKSQG